MTKPKTKTEDSIYSGFKFECKECQADFGINYYSNYSLIYS